MRKMRRWKGDLKGVAGLDYIVFKGVPMRESKWGDVIEIRGDILERLAAEAIILQRVPLRGREVRFLRKSMGMTFETFGAELDMSPSTVCKWEKKLDDRLHPFNEVALRAYFAEKLDVEMPGKLSELIGTKKSPGRLVLKAS